MPLLLLGYWKASLDDSFPFPQQAEAALDPRTRRAVVSYLGAGALVQQYRGHSHCRYGCPGDNGSSELSDGIWVWPSGLAHYVWKHGVSLPPEFLAHARREDGDGTATPATPTGELRRDVDDSLWLRWAAARAPEWLATALQKARATASQRKAAALATAAKKLALAEGLSKTNCITAGCGQRALAGSAFCAACALELQAFHPGTWEIEAEELATVQAMFTSKLGA